MFGIRNPIEIIVILAIVLIFFGGRNKISSTMSDLANGIKNFRKGLKDTDKPEQPTTVPAPMIGEPINVTPEKDKTKA
jgi:sec-independent protein translocase protein TatA